MEQKTAAGKRRTGEILEKQTVSRHFK